MYSSKVELNAIQVKYSTDNKIETIQN